MKQLEFGVRRLVTSHETLVEWSDCWDMIQDESMHKSTRLHEKMRSMKALCVRMAEEQRCSAVPWLDFREYEQRVQLHGTFNAHIAHAVVEEPEDAEENLLPNANYQTR